MPTMGVSSQTTQSVLIEVNSDGVGTVVVRGAAGPFTSNLHADQNIDIGAGGSASLDVRGGGFVDATNIHIGRDGGSTDCYGPRD